MSCETKTLVFFTGLGAPIDLYHDFIKCMSEQIPHKSIHLLEWWSQEDFGKKELTTYLQNEGTILIGHSAGGSMAIDALAAHPDVIERVIMLDSHTLKGMKSLPSLEAFLDILLKPDGEEVISRVRAAYVPLMKESASFDRALAFLSEWVSRDLSGVFSTIKAMKEHTVLHLGSTDAHYQVLDNEQQIELKKFWGQHHFDIEFLPMSHFDLIVPHRAASIIQVMTGWLKAYPAN